MATVIDSPPSRFVAWWKRFWFEPTSVSTVTVLRIAYGVVLIGWALVALSSAVEFYSDQGLLPAAPDVRYRLTALEALDSPIAIYVGLVVLLVAALALTLGYRAQVAAVVTFVLLLSFQRRNPYLNNGGDALLRIMGLFLIFAPVGAGLSVDRWREGGRDAFWRFSLRAPWAQRMIQIQVSVLYLFSTWAKARGDLWVDGTALGWILRIGHYQRFAVPQAITESLFLSNVLTYGTIAVELALATLIWNRRARPWVIGLGIALHVFIEVTMALAFFSIAMFVSYISFVPEDSMDGWVSRRRERMRSSRFGLLRTLAGVGP